MTPNTQHLLQILKSWHMVEFFQPYTIEERKDQVRILHSELDSAQNNLLPWLNPAARVQLKIPAGQVRYELHLGIFNKSEVTRISHQIFGPETDPILRDEQEQRLDDEGLTCFAKLSLDQFGTPNFSNMSVSTLPWALGNLQQGVIDQMSYETYEQRVELLKEQLSRIEKKLYVHPTDGQTLTVEYQAIQYLHKTLQQWAGFCPESRFMLVLDWYPDGVASKQAGHTKHLPNNSALKETEIDEEENEDDEAVDAEDVLPILNSFYIEDIEKAILSLGSDNQSKALSRYLTPCGKKHEDLYTQAGLQRIIHHLHPARMPAGRWPSAPQHNMSLMQQFAINTAIETLSDGGLLSVNGPPGTGKTTLLRDLVAHNVVERAKVLAGFSSVEVTLDPEGFPVSALGGFEMVVASSNNAAVENISKELPQMTSLGEAFQHFEYLKPVANQMAAKRKFKRTFGENKPNCYHPLQAEEHCWGTIAAAMGKKKNREEFAQRFFFDKHFKIDSEKERKRPDHLNFLNFWRWRKNTKIKSFALAKRDFIASLHKVESIQQGLIDLADLMDDIAGCTEEEYTGALNQVLKQASAQYESEEAMLKKALREHEHVQTALEDMQEKNRHHKAKRPGLLTRFFQRKKYQAYLDQLSENRVSIKSLHEKLKTLLTLADEKQKRLIRLKQKSHEATEHLQKGRLEYREKRNRVNELKEKYQGIAMPDRMTPISDAQLQRNAFWQNSTINTARSQLFSDAIALHESWLNEVCVIDACHQKLREISSFLKMPTGVTKPMPYWRLIFMMVPVLSTTFASLGRMFHGVSASELGWLMIDEAGQAPPQAAVGGLLRAKRVLVVGDPLQIEPVFTTSPRLVKGICDTLLNSESGDWNPGLKSVQQIADRANAYGCLLEVENKPEWIGIPLWVHRRCIEPMFTLANEMAYQGRMIHGSDVIQPQPLFDGMENHWLKSTGVCTKRQHKRELETDTLGLIDELIFNGHALSSIYIISPFKAVASGLKRAVTEMPLPENTKRRDFENWQKNNIGTVHTFQGKENSTVLLVLGCDPANSGGAKWASSKPNLLNVALTRAKRNIVVIGDLRVWRSLPYFSQLAMSVTVKESDYSMENI